MSPINAHTITGLQWHLSVEFEADPQRFPVLIWGLPDTWTVHAKQLQESIRPGGKGAPLGITWLQVAQELATTGQQLGISRTGDPKPKIN